MFFTQRVKQCTKLTVLHDLKGSTSQGCHINLLQPIFFHLHYACLKCLTQMIEV